MSIYYAKKRRQFHARRYINGKMHHIGYYDTPEEAYEKNLNWIPPSGKKRPIANIKPFDKEHFERMRGESNFDSKPLSWWQEKSKQQIKELTDRYGPKLRSMER